MEQEILKYRQQSFKGKLLMAKKFTKFYFNQFRPITKLEESDVKRARSVYRGFTVITAITFGYMSFRFRRMKMSMIEAHEAPRDMNFLVNVINDAILIFFGYTIGHLIACDYIYKRRTYIMERLYFEKQNNFNRNSYTGELQQEYPFAEFVEIKDKDIIEDRLHPIEVRDNADKMREKLEQINQEYEQKIKDKHQ